MDSQTGDQDSEKGRVIPLSEHPLMDRLDEILRDLPPDRQRAFDQWVSEQIAEDVTDHTSGHEDEE